MDSGNSLVICTGSGSRVRNGVQPHCRPRKKYWVRCASALTVIVLGLAVARAEGAVGLANEPAVSLETTTVEAWGWIVAQERRVAGVELNDAELAAFMKGFSAQLHHKAPPASFREMLPAIEAMAKQRRQKIVREIERRNEAQAERYFQELKKRSNLIELPGGALAEMLKPGDGATPKLGQTVNVHYAGRLIDGTEFTQFGPIDLVLVPNRSVCRGWIDAIQRLRKGGAMRLYVPPPLPEGEADNFGIEPGSAMIFEIELLGIQETSPEALASSVAPPPRDDSDAASRFSSLEVAEAWGWSVAQQSRIAALGLSETESAAVAQGVRAGVVGRPPPPDLAASQPRIQRFVAERRESLRNAERRRRREEREALFARLQSEPKVVAQPDGLRYEIVEPGAGAPPKPGQIVLVNYTGRLVDGAVFDRTDNEPLNIEVGTVIRGWNEGIQRIGRGGRIKLYIPPELGYGENSISAHLGVIPPDSVLIYDIELIEIKDSLPGPEPEKK